MLGPKPLDVDISDDYFNRKISNHLPIDTCQFTMKEIDKCLSKPTKSKAPGPDNIHTMIWKHPIFKNELLTFYNEVLNWILPSALSKLSMFATSKEGDLKLPSNYSGITLTAISANISSIEYQSTLNLPCDEIKMVSENVDRPYHKFLHSEG